MVVWLYNQPEWLTALIFVAVVTLPALLSPYLARRLQRHAPSADAQIGTLEAYKLTSTLTALLLIFSLVQAVRLADAADTQSNKEAMDILQLDRTLGRLPDPRAGAARVLVRDYLTTVIEKEWPAQQQGRMSAAGNDAFHRLLEATRVLTPPTADVAQLYADEERSVEDVGDDRARRIAATESGLPEVYWWVVALLFAMLVMLGAGLPLRRGWTIPMGAHVAALGLLLAILFIVDRPYVGRTSLRPAPLQRALAVMDGR